MEKEDIQGLVTKNKITTTLIVEKGGIFTEMFLRFDFDINVTIEGVEFQNLKFFRTQKLTAEEVAQLLLADAKFKLGVPITEKYD